MRQQFDPRTMLKQSSIALLHQFFEQRGELLDLPWEELKANRRFELIYQAWQALPDPQRRHVQAIFQEAWEFAEERAIQAFADELHTAAPQRAWEFTACGSRLNKVLWVYVNFPNLFEKASLFARADWLSSSRYAVRRNSLPKQAITVTPEMLAALATALRDYYWPNEMRGMHCRVEHYTRSDGNQYFFAYLDDWPDLRLVCEEDGQFESISQRDAFSLLFVFCPHDGSLELVVKGSKSVHYPLQRAFVKSVFGIDVEPANPLLPAYQLAQVLDSNFTYPTEASDRIAAVRLSHVQLEPAPNSICTASLDIHFEPTTCRRQWTETIHQILKALGLAPEEVNVKKASFQLTFFQQGFGRTKTMTFTVSTPSSCDLKTKTDELHEIGNRCLQRWGMLS